MCPTIDKSRRAGGIRLICTLVAELNYELSSHAVVGVENNDFSPEDIEASIASGTVLKTDADEFCESVGNKKYTIVGKASCGRPIYTVGKIVRCCGELTYRFISIKCDEVNYD